MFSPMGKKKILLQKRSNKVSFDDTNSTTVNEQQDNDETATAASPNGRSSSPKRAKREQDMTDRIASTANLERALADIGVTGEIMRRIMESTVRYNPERDAVMLKGFQHKHIDYDRFRNYLYSLFWLEFNDEEFQAFLDYFEPNRNGTINGYDFMIAFIRLNGIRKSRHAMIKREQNEAAELKRKADAERKELEKEKKNELAANFYFSDDVRKVALQKLHDAAFKYDPNHPSSASYSAFQVSKMKPAVFKEMLKLTFNLKVDRAELGAILKEFDPNIEDEIPAADFLRYFMRIGIEAREQALKDQRTRNKELEQLQEQEQKKKAEQAAAKMSLEVDFDFTPLEESSAMGKIRMASKKYDPAAPGSVSLEGFEVDSLEPGEFKDLVRRVFNMTLSSGELGSIVQKYDKHKTGRVHCKTFLIDFNQMGQQARYKEHLEQLALQRQLIAKAEADHIKKVEEVANSDTVRVSWKFADKDLQSGMDKLRTAALKYDPVRGVALTSFEPKYCTPLEFKKGIKRAFDLKLTPKEMGAVVKHFDRDRCNKVHNKTFLNTFTELGFKARSEVYSDQLQRQRDANRKAQEEHQRKMLDLDSKELYSVEFDFTPEDKHSALRKVTAAAAKYDPGHPAAMGLEGFERKTMQGGEFKELVRRTFLLKLTGPEVGALFSFFGDRAATAATAALDGEEGEGKDPAKKAPEQIDCGEFLRYFLHLGYHERDLVHKEQLEKQRREDREREEEHERKVLELSNRVTFTVDHKYTEKDRKSIYDKIAVAAEGFDKSHPAAPSLEAFDMAYLPPGIFRENIKRVFNVVATPKEIGVLMADFDKNKTGQIDSKDFLNKFQAIGKKIRWDKRREFLEKERQAKKAAQREAEEKLNALWAKKDLEVDHDFSPDDFASATEKMTASSAKYDKTHPSAPSLDGFSGGPIQPGVFQELMRRAFNVWFTPKELGSVASRFRHATYHDKIDGKQFLIYFMKLGFEFRGKEKALALEKQRRTEMEQRQEQERKLRMSEQRVALDVNIKDYSLEDRQDAMRKLTAAAALYDKNAPGAVALNAFDSAYLSPGMFREVAKRTFNVVFTNNELASIIDQFNYGNGNLNCAAFLVTFIKLGADERDKAKVVQLEKQRRENYLRKTEHERIMKENEMKIELKVSYEYTDEQRDSAFEKLIVQAKKYDKSHPGAMSLDGFQEKTMKPHVFREMLKRTFGVYLTHEELGACMHYFDPHKTGVVSSKKFLIYFLKLGIAEREKDRKESLLKLRNDAIMREREHQEKMAAQWAKMELKVNFDFTDKDRDSAMEKLAKAAVAFDPASPGPMGLTAFHAKHLSPAVFREMLRRSFNMRVSDKELAALVKEFDKENNNTVSCQDFMVRFTALGFEGRSLRTTAQLERQRRMDAEARQAAEQKQFALDHKLDAKLNMDFSADDFNSALDKIRRLAANYDRAHASAPSLQGFMGTNMKPNEFKDMMMRTFHEPLTDKQLGALVSVFGVTGGDDGGAHDEDGEGKEDGGTASHDEDDEENENDEQVKGGRSRSSSPSRSQSRSRKSRQRGRGRQRGGTAGSSTARGSSVAASTASSVPADGDGVRVDNMAFLQYFNKIQRDEQARKHRERIARERLLHQKEKEHQDALDQKKKEAELNRLVFSPEDEAAMVGKIREAAQQYAVDSALFIEPLQGFKGPALPPDKFRELFRQIFGIRMSFPETGSLLNILDTTGMGTFDGGRFLNWFYKLARQEERFMLGESADHVTLESLRAATTFGASGPTRPGATSNNSTTRTRTQASSRRNPSLSKTTPETAGFSNYSQKPSEIIAQSRAQLSSEEGKATSSSTSAGGKKTPKYRVNKNYLPGDDSTFSDAYGFDGRVDRNSVYGDGGGGGGGGGSAQGARAKDFHQFTTSTLDKSWVLPSISAAASIASRGGGSRGAGSGSRASTASYAAMAAAAAVAAAAASGDDSVDEVDVDETEIWELVQETRQHLQSVFSADLNSPTGPNSSSPWLADRNQHSEDDEADVGFGYSISPGRPRKSLVAAGDPDVMSRSFLGGSDSVSMLTSDWPKGGASGASVGSRSAATGTAGSSRASHARKKGGARPGSVSQQMLVPLIVDGMGTSPSPSPSHSSTANHRHPINPLAATAPARSTTTKSSSSADNYHGGKDQEEQFLNELFNSATTLDPATLEKYRPRTSKSKHDPMVKLQKVKKHFHETPIALKQQQQQQQQQQRVGTGKNKKLQSLKSSNSASVVGSRRSGTADTKSSNPAELSDKDNYDGHSAANIPASSARSSRSVDGADKPAFFFPALLGGTAPITRYSTKAGDADEGEGVDDNEGGADGTNPYDASTRTGAEAVSSRPVIADVPNVGIVGNPAGCNDASGVQSKGRYQQPPRQQQQHQKQQQRDADADLMAEAERAAGVPTISASSSAPLEAEGGGDTGDDGNLTAASASVNEDIAFLQRLMAQ